MRKKRSYEHCTLAQPFEWFKT